MPPIHISATSRALYRVFVVPNISTTAARTQPLPQPTRLLHQTPIIYGRPSKTFPPRRNAISDHYVVDEKIQAEHVKYVNADGQFEGIIPFQLALRKVNRASYHLVQMSSDEDPPVCKLNSKKDLREKIARKLEIERRTAQGSYGSGPAPKSIELNWGVASRDLNHRLAQLQGFLREGRKVEVLLAPKKRGKKATEEEAEAVLDAVKRAALECKGTSEAKSSGSIGGPMTVVFEGRNLEEKENKEEEKGEKSDEEKAKDWEKLTNNKWARRRKEQEAKGRGVFL